MRNITLTLLTALTLCLGNFSIKSQNVTEDSLATQHIWQSSEVELMANLIPILYKDVLRLDSCKADAKILDSLNNVLEDIVEEHEITIEMQDEMVRLLNIKTDEMDLMFKRKNEQIKLIKKKSYWRGFKHGSGVTVGVLLILTIIIL